jgi:plastocyanin
VMLTVPVGTTLRFVNTDGFAHTATKISGTTTFPGPYPFNGSALTQSGSALSGAWTTGALNAGSASQTFIADQAGTYIFGCFFHYEAPMRGVIVVQ